MKHLHPKGKTVKNRCMPVFVRKRLYTSQEFVEHVAAFEHLPKNQIGGALAAIVDDLCYLLADGNIVELG